MAFFGTEAQYPGDEVIITFTTTVTITVTITITITITITRTFPRVCALSPPSPAMTYLAHCPSTHCISPLHPNPRPRACLPPLVFINSTTQCLHPYQAWR
jgi:hypothetical protein